MKVELQEEWLGHQKGAVVTVNDNYAKEMISRKTAVEVKEEVERKGFKKPEVNKMVGGPEVNK